ncbi:DoxX family protein [Sphingomonas sp.]|uniref:DoxX family protein n=1 Tax=Sphingomonas sp. TaxID=28214 RepID=UPI0025DC531B|nr:DoxX family protein [Sphingomonas sp.]
MTQARAIARLVLAVAYFAVGIVHLKSPGGFVAITPDWVPYPREVILATGMCEIAGSVALLVPRLRWWAGVMLALYALCVFPANIKHAVDGIAVGGVVLGPWYHVPRLLFQPVIIWWALWAGAVIDWPFRRAGPAQP